MMKKGEKGLLNLPSPDTVYNKSDIFGGLGDFWYSVFRETDIVSALSSGASNFTAQLFQKYKETRCVAAVNTVPVFSRLRWRMVVIRDIDRDQAPALKLRLDADPLYNLGEQQAPAYENGSMACVGGYIPRAGYTAYRYTGESIAAIYDRLSDPRHILLPDNDFTVEEGTILFKKGKDPFELGFPVRHLSGGIKEVALWCRDTEVDTDMVNRFAGYLVGAYEPSSRWFLSYITSLMRFAQSGGSESAYLEYVYSALDVPHTKRNSEKIVRVTPDSPKGTRTIITDRDVYTVPRKDAEKFKEGDIIPPLHPVSSAVSYSGRTGGKTACSIALPIPPNVKRGVNGRLSVAYQDSDITYVGDDINGNPRLRIRIHGKEEDIKAFWSYADRHAEDNKLDQQDYFTPWLNDSRPRLVGSVWGKVSPARFFVDLYYGNNAKFLVVEEDRLSDFGRRGLQRLLACKAYTPLSTRIILTVCKSTEGIEDVRVEEAEDVGKVFATQTAEDVVPLAEDQVFFNFLPLCGS